MLKVLLLAAALSASLSAASAPKAPGALSRSAEVSPFVAKYFLVAGSGDPAFRDGSFLQAAFRSPESLVLSKDGQTLYVADEGAQALRSVDLAHQDRVGTLCGNGEAGRADGPAAQARLDGPRQLQLSADGRSLYFLDQAGHALRRYAIATREVSTELVLPAGPGFRALACNSQGPGLWLTQGDRLLLWAGQGTRPQALLQDPAFACPQGRLLMVDTALYYADPCGGRLDRLQAPQGGLPLSPAPEGLSPAAAVLGPVPGAVLGPKSVGFCPLQRPDEPWSILCWDPDADAFLRYSTGGGAAVTLEMRDYQGTTLLGPSADMVGINATSDRRSLFQGPLSFVPGPSGLLYGAQAAAHRVVGVDLQLFHEIGADVNVIRATEAKRPGVTRLLVLGDSLIYYWRDYGPEKRYNAALSFVRQLELDLNLEAALRGSGRRYEVQAVAKQLGHMDGSAPSLYLEMAEQLKGRQADQVLLVVDGMSFIRELFQFSQNQTEDDLATLPFQLDWHEMSPAQRYQAYGPLRRGLIDDVKAHPEDYRGWMEVDAAGEIHFLKSETELVTLPRIQRFAHDLLHKALQKCQGLARAQGSTLVVVLLPSRDLVELGEGGGDYDYDHMNPAALDAPLAQAAAELGIPSYSLTAPMRLLALPFYPLIVKGDHHYSARAQGWLAELLARQMTGSLDLGVQGRP